mmetsp:Transcript_19655/g.28891  ORF Transcript_19655/g.28891 Transcript_19655/m.28891 type:complete len:510 (-) Transcript_19655:32-1561(-)|eukprot:CAMPEP_0195514858 /NCGR_PEP_ID=MMETSP0794_2-20130614/6119_1 /TAXON_ID=515487 /ORGANISM="Stephanopyxis turris, Strain CCMP 815" /LENGTH=509 /DNA_ID=CAMNT_0040643187 /DNA_START=46 /DNA_END=1575 /DNA_ORIENTATION=-
MPKKNRNHSEVIAATAGLNNWRTLAGRIDGSDDFEILDLFRVAKRKVLKSIYSSIPSAGTPCPVCFVEPESYQEWHVTSACEHAVCIDCLRGYASSQVQDVDHVGPLKCPVCPMPLREKDAIAALKHDSEILKKLDAKIRDQFLRALPSYRHCPHCESDADGNDDNGLLQTLSGGGFVTPECLAPINTRRELQAEWLLGTILPLSSKVLIGAYVAYIRFYTKYHSRSVFVDLVNSFSPLWVAWRLCNVIHLLIARAARTALFEPIVVECPCCNKEFILNAETELSNGSNSTAAADEATKEWMGNNSRPCPSCSAPISKVDGCNHMKCSHCRASFCWACMKLRTRCAAYRCSNGAPYGGDAQPNNNNHNVVLVQEGCIDKITRIEQRVTTLDQKDAIMFTGILIAVLAKDSSQINTVATFTVTFMASVLSAGFVMTCILMFVCFTFITSSSRRPSSRRRSTTSAALHFNLNEDNNSQGQQQQNRSYHQRIGESTEEEMIAEAVARSLQAN